VKLYVEEQGADEVRGLVGEASLVATSLAAYAEARAAFARQRREGGLTSAGLRRLSADLDADWPGFLALEVTPPLARRAGELAERHALRGFDSLHLASFLAVVDEFASEEVQFSSFDEALNRAARRARRRSRPDHS
jgi:hypothetical protein